VPLVGSSVLEAKKPFLSKHGMNLLIFLFLGEFGTCLQNLIPVRGVEHWKMNYFSHGGMLKFTSKGHFLTIKKVYKKLLYWKSIWQANPPTHQPWIQKTTWRSSLKSYNPYLLLQKVSKNPQTYCISSSLSKYGKCHHGLSPLGVKKTNFHKKIYFAQYLIIRKVFSQKHRRRWYKRSFVIIWYSQSRKLIFWICH
jgi:hypothetical protein